MPSRRQVFRHQFSGGWATDFGNSAEVGISQNGLVQIPFLVNAENIKYEFDGGIHKIGGATRTNASALNSAEQIMGLFDYWRGETGAGTQRIVLHTGTLLMASDDQGATFSNISTGLVDEAIPSYETFDDLLIVSSDANADVPLKYNQSGNASTLGTNTPNFSFSRSHKNRLWGAGVLANGSRLYYSPDLASGGPDGDWDGATAGTIDIDPGDGDVITGLASHRNELWVFKGPHRGSIHRIAGSAPTGSDGFARQMFVRGLGAVSHNLIFSFRGDLGFVWSDGSVHSLLTTASFGDYNEAALSRPIQSHIRDHVHFTRLKRGTAVTNEEQGGVLIAVPVDGSDFSNQVYYMDYRFDPVRWAQWPALGSNNAVASLAHYVDTSDSNKAIVLAGGEDGFVRRLDRLNRHIDSSTAYQSRATAPFINYGDPFRIKTIYAASLGVRQAGTTTLTFGWTNEVTGQQTQTVSGGTGVVLGGTSSTNFTLDRDTLGAAGFVDRFMSLETGGEFRSIQYEVSNNVVDQDMNIAYFGAQLRLGPQSLENA